MKTRRNPNQNDFVQNFIQMKEEKQRQEEVMITLFTIAIIGAVVAIVINVL